MAAEVNDEGSSIQPRSFYSKGSGYRDPLERRRLYVLQSLNSENSVKDLPTQNPPVSKPKKKAPTKTARNGKKFTVVKKKALKSSQKLSKPVQMKAKEVPKPVPMKAKELPKPMKRKAEELPKVVQEKAKEPSKQVQGEAKEPSKQVQVEAEEPPKLVQEKSKECATVPLQQNFEGADDHVDEPPAKKRRFFSRPLQIVPQATRHVFGRHGNKWNTRFVVKRASTLRVENPPFLRAILRGPKEGNDIVMIEPTNKPLTQQTSEECDPSRAGIQPTKANFPEQGGDENLPPACNPQDIVVDSPRKCHTFTHSTPYPSTNNPTDDAGSPSLFAKGEDRRALYPIFCPAKLPQTVTKKTKFRTERQQVQKKCFQTAALDPAQLIIDAGQKRFGAVACSDCGMVYSAGDAEDEAYHRQHHETRCGTVKFPGWKDERVVWATSEGRVVLVLAGDGKHKLRKVVEIRKRVERDLGEEEEEEKEKDWLHLIYVIQKEVVGYLAARKITEAYRVDPSGTAENSESIRYHPDPLPAVCGVSRVWVADSYRRRGVATKLLDCLRSTFTGEETIFKDGLAFSVPTSAGRRLAAAYSGTEAFLIFW